MIECRLINNRIRPVVVCDECRQIITDIRMGMVIYDKEKVYIYHKRSCDPATKTGSFPDIQLGWSELSHFLERLWHNTQIDIPEEERVTHEAAKKAIDFLQEV